MIEFFPVSMPTEYTLHGVYAVAGSQQATGGRGLGGVGLRGRKGVRGWIYMERSRGGGDYALSHGPRSTIDSMMSAFSQQP